MPLVVLMQCHVKSEAGLQQLKSDRLLGATHIDRY